MNPIETFLYNEIKRQSGTPTVTEDELGADWTAANNGNWQAIGVGGTNPGAVEVSVTLVNAQRLFFSGFTNWSLDANGSIWTIGIGINGATPTEHYRVYEGLPGLVDRIFGGTSWSFWSAELAAGAYTFKLWTQRFPGEVQLAIFKGNGSADNVTTILQVTQYQV